MLAWYVQAWLGLTIMLAAFSMWRMGPAFERSRYGPPLALLGLALMIFVAEPLLYFEEGYIPCSDYFVCIDDARDEYLSTIVSTVTWITLAVLGCRTITQGSSWYNRRRPELLVAGWAMLTAAWWILSQMQLYHLVMENPIDVLLGIALIVLPILLSIWMLMRAFLLAERQTPRDPEIDALDEREQRLVTEMIRRNLGGGPQ